MSVQQLSENKVEEAAEMLGIFVGSEAGGGSHLNPMLEICKILIDRGYNITLVANPGNFTATSTLYHSIPQISLSEPIDTNSSPEYREIFLTNILIKPDLFFCDYVTNEACFDLAWKLKKPVVGFVSYTMYFTASPPFRSDPIFGCHVNMENRSFYDRFRCAVVQPLRLRWYFRKNINYLNARRAKVGVSKNCDYRGTIADTLFLVDNFFGFE
ncbi:3588_t:CDS:2, partial [Scutellospora calospora]